MYLLIPLNLVLHTYHPSHKQQALCLDITSLDSHLCSLYSRAKQILFTIDVANTRTRTAEYHAELDYIYNQLQDEIRRTGASKISVMSPLLDLPCCSWVFSIFLVVHGFFFFLLCCSCFFSIFLVVHGFFPSSLLFMGFFFNILPLLRLSYNYKCK